MFLDISLPIRNEFGTGVTNSSLEMALENYLKPDVLEGENQYMCGACNQKRDALKGLKIDVCPAVICINFNRFTLDYETFQRVKVTDRVSFPRILNMNAYMQGYEGIEEKLYEKEVERVTQYDKQQVEKNLEREMQKQRALEAKREQQKPAATEVSSLVEVAQEYDQQMMAAEDTRSQPTKTTQVTQTSQSYTPQRKTETGVSITVGAKERDENEVLASLYEIPDSENPYLFDCKGPKKRIDYAAGDGQDHGDMESYDLDLALGHAAEAIGGDPGAYSVKYTNEKFRLGAATAASKQTQEEKELMEALEQIRQMEEREKNKDTEQDLISKFIQRGQHVYELFSILIHSGSALGGHYYAYIKSFEDDKWYNFNDSSVRQIPDADVQAEIEAMFGGGTGNANTSSYMLQYRKVVPADSRPEVSPDLVPEYLRDEIEFERIKMIDDKKLSIENLLRMSVKVYGTDGSADKFRLLGLKKNQTMRELHELVRQNSDDKFNPGLPSNFRLRNYDPRLDVMLKVFEPNDMTLMDLGIHNYFLLKVETEPFADFDEEATYIRVLFWDQPVAESEEDHPCFGLQELDQLPFKVL